MIAVGDIVRVVNPRSIDPRERFVVVGVGPGAYTGHTVVNVRDEQAVYRSFYADDLAVDSEHRPDGRLAAIRERVLAG